MFDIIAQLKEIECEFREIGYDIIADKIAKLIESYKPRVQRQRRTRGVTKIRRKQYYKRNRPKIKRRQKIYRKKRRVQLKRRKRLRHFKRIGQIAEDILNQIF